MFSKTIIVVDKDVDVQNLSEVAWIVGTHYDPERDIQFTRGPVDDLEDASDLPTAARWESTPLASGQRRIQAAVAEEDLDDRGGGGVADAQWLKSGKDGVRDHAAVSERLAQGKLQPADAEIVLGSHDLVAIGMMADEIRRRVGRDTTFVRVFEAHVDAVPATLPVNVTAGEFRLTGRPASLAAAVAAVAAMRCRHGTLVRCSLADLERLGEPDTYAQLSGAGLDGIAELPIDLLAVPGRFARHETPGCSCCG